VSSFGAFGAIVLTSVDYRHGYPSPMDGKPTTVEPAEEEQLRVNSDAVGCDEQKARFIRALNGGEITGDVVPLQPADEPG
jgi:hypothetical protein